MLLARAGGRLHAVGATCTHLGGPLGEGVLVGGQVRCPWHHARFALATGEAVGAPALEPLPCFAVEERGGRVLVTGRRPRPERPRPAAEPPLRVVVLGGGAAGHACAELLARSGFGGRVAVVTDDPDPPYDRTFCSKQYLIGMVGRDDCALDGAGIYGSDGSSDGAVRLVRERAAALDLGRREVVTEGGERHAELWPDLGDGARSGGAVIGRRVGDAVGEGDARDDHGQAVLAFQAAPGLRGGHHELEDHEACRLLRQGALGAGGSMADGGEDALDGVGGAQVIPDPMIAV